jgi:hypothetical protein
VRIVLFLKKASIQKIKIFQQQWFYDKYTAEIRAMNEEPLYEFRGRGTDQMVQTTWCGWGGYNGTDDVVRMVVRTT